MQNINKIFIEEGNELVSDLESHLIDLEASGVSSDIVNGIFRVMHSLKGGSSMFGFTKLDELTHNLESIYNKVRDDNSKLSQSIIDVTFKSVDLIKELLSEDISNKILRQTDKLIEEIKLVVDNLEGGVDTNISDNKDSSSSSSKSYYILFKPNQDILTNGTNPLYVVEELLDIASDYHVIARNNDIPSLENFDVEKSYAWWELFIYTAADVDEIESVFMFVEEDAEIIIEEISNDNVFSYNNIREDINELAKAGDYIDYKSIFANKSNLENKEEVKQNSTNKNKILNIKVDTHKLDNLINMVSELVTAQARFRMYAEKQGDIEFVAISEEITKITTRLRDTAFSITLIPIESILIKFRRLVRDLSISQSKDILFVTEGADTELDKKIIETIDEPILHLIRNSIDHGIESLEERKKLGKPEKGTIKLKSFYSGSEVHIQISDDGAGINLEKVRAKAISKGIIDKGAKLSEKELIELIWTPGFSTADVVSDVSGRGVGMDVVKKKIGEVRGDIEIETQEGKGSTFTLRLPLTLSIIDGLIVSVADDYYIIPLTVISKIHRIEHSVLHQSYNDLVIVEEEQIPYIYLRDYFSYEENNEQEHIVIVEYENQKVGIVVDNIVAEYQAVLKPLGKHYKKINIFTGASILGDGSLALVLDTNMIVREKTKGNI